MITASTKIVVNNTAKITATMKARSRLAVMETAHWIQGHIRAKMAEPKHGRTYRRGAITRKASKRLIAAGVRTRNGGKRAVVGYRFHRASAPGEAPAMDTGHLANSIQVGWYSGDTAAVYTNAEQAAVLEFGGARVAARPSFRPAAEQAQPLFLMKMRNIARTE